MFKWLFGDSEDYDDFEEIEEESPVVTPVVESRRKEKFNEPFYNNEFPQEEKKEEPAVVERVERKEEERKVVQQPKRTVTRVKKNEEYQMRQIISPMAGLVDDPLNESDGSKAEAPRKKKMKINKDDLVPVLSPFYGMEMQNDTEENQPADETKGSQSSSKKAKPSESANRDNKRKGNINVISVNEPVNDSIDVADAADDRLRNIGKLTEDTRDDLKIIEERTGKFNLDFKSEEETSTDIDDNMSLDELMNLYEKKFNQ